MKNSELADLKSFLGAYFHEDWPIESGNPDGAIQLFLDSAPSAALRVRIVSQINDYLHAKEEAGIEEGLLKDLGCYYLPSADGMRASAWLEHVANRLKFP